MESWVINWKINQRVLPWKLKRIWIEYKNYLLLCMPCTVKTHSCPMKIHSYSSQTTHLTCTSSMANTSLALSLLPSGVTQTLISKRNNHWLWCPFKPLLLKLPIMGHGQRSHSEFSDFQIYSYWSSLCSINSISYDNTIFPISIVFQESTIFFVSLSPMKHLLYLLIDAHVCVSVRAQLYARSWALNDK